MLQKQLIVTSTTVLLISLSFIEESLNVHGYDSKDEINLKVDVISRIA